MWPWRAALADVVSVRACVARLPQRPHTHRRCAGSRRSFAGPSLAQPAAAIFARGQRARDCPGKPSHFAFASASASAFAFAFAFAFQSITPPRPSFCRACLRDTPFRLAPGSRPRPRPPSCGARESCSAGSLLGLPGPRLTLLTPPPLALSVRLRAWTARWLCGGEAADRSHAGAVVAAAGVAGGGAWVCVARAI